MATALTPIHAALPKPEDNFCEAIARLEAARIHTYAHPSVAAARENLHQLEGTPYEATPDHPVMLIIQGVLYCSYSVEALAPVNETERKVDGYSNQQREHSVGRNQFSTMVTTTMAAKNYDRMFVAYAQAWGKASTGANVNLALAGQDDRVAFVSKIEAGSSGEGVSVSGIFRVNAGETPRVKMGIYGSPEWGNGGTVSLTSQSQHTALTCLAMPVTMAS